MIWNRIDPTKVLVLATAIAAAACGGGSQDNISVKTAGGGSDGLGSAGSSAAAGGLDTSAGAGGETAAAGSNASAGSSAGGAAATVGVSVSPQVAKVAFAGNVQFGVVVSGVADHAVTWTVQEGASAGTVDATGRYTAPSTAGKYHVIATSTANSALKATAEVTVTAPQGTPPALATGVWKEITPPIPGFSGTFGATAVEVSPVDPRTVYISVDVAGIWRTTDGGSNWEVVGDPSKPPNGGDTTAFLDSPVRLEVDPGDPNHLYATEGVRGGALGFWVSKDAGANWTKPKGFVSIAAQATHDVTAMAVSPADFKHILLGSHSAWVGRSDAGILESRDGGESWVAHPPGGPWPAGSLGIDFLYDPPSGQGNADTWLVSTDGNGFWRTEDAGKTWTQVSTINTAHGGAHIYYAKDGTLYSGAAGFPLRSKDNGKTWEQLTDTGLPYYYYYMVCGDGDSLFTQGSYATLASRQDTFWSATESGAKSWSKDKNGQIFNNGPSMMRFDAANNIMYSVNWGAGVWALKTK